MLKLSADRIKESLCNTSQITFEITEKCNLCCVYCGYGKLYSDKDVRTNRNLPIERAKSFLRYMYYLWKSEYNKSNENNIYISFYGGEPLVNFNFIKQVVDFIETELIDCNRKFTYSMTTNAILLLRYIDYIVAKNFHVLISLDGNESGSSYRIDKNNNPVFKRVVDVALVIKNKFPKYFQSNIEFNAVLHDRNSVESIYTFFKTMFNKRPSIGEINTSGINPSYIEKFKQMFKSNQESLLSSNQYFEIEQKLNFESSTYNSAFNYLLMRSPYSYMDYNELLFGKKNNRKELPSGTCIPFSKKVFITVSGKILPCERISHKYYIGILNESGVNIDFENISQLYNSYYNIISSMCSECYDYKSCLCCVFHIDVLDNSSIRCKYFMDEEDHKKYLLGQYAFFRRHPELYAELMKNAEYY